MDVKRDGVGYRWISRTAWHDWCRILRETRRLMGLEAMPRHSMSWGDDGPRFRPYSDVTRRFSFGWQLNAEVTYKRVTNRYIVTYLPSKMWSAYLNKERRIIDAAPEIPDIEPEPWPVLDYPKESW